MKGCGGMVHEVGRVVGRENISVGIEIEQGRMFLRLAALLHLPGRNRVTTDLERASLVFPL